ncbi:hypothetical protein CBR_g18692 [Chara braunii]|uniref:EF-hand domain-containing protein n=1 Tax=Chara braunii TaxID=69332 RepID=A0A388KW62_CHABU|nr:hypothetical protein CBR_g18692 [Chara braunii]|eukprot:GBG74281.1 hypothetical protein CBR_g18692 [Chara braunii]
MAASSATSQAANPPAPYSQAAQKAMNEGEKRWRRTCSKRIEDKDTGFLVKPMIEDSMVLNYKQRLTTVEELHQVGKTVEHVFTENRRARQKAGENNGESQTLQDAEDEGDNMECGSGERDPTTTSLRKRKGTASGTEEDTQVEQPGKRAQEGSTTHETHGSQTPKLSQQQSRGEGSSPEGESMETSQEETPTASQSSARGVGQRPMRGRENRTGEEIKQAEEDQGEDQGDEGGCTAGRYILSCDAAVRGAKYVARFASPAGAGACVAAGDTTRLHEETGALSAAAVAPWSGAARANISVADLDPADGVATIVAGSQAGVVVAEALVLGALCSAPAAFVSGGISPSAGALNSAPALFAGGGRGPFAVAGPLPDLGRADAGSIAVGVVVDECPAADCDERAAVLGADDGVTASEIHEVPCHQLEVVVGAVRSPHRVPLLACGFCGSGGGPIRSRVCVSAGGSVWSSVWGVSEEGPVWSPVWSAAADTFTSDTGWFIAGMMPTLVDPSFVHDRKSAFTSQVQSIGMGGNIHLELAIILKDFERRWTIPLSLSSPQKRSQLGFPRSKGTPLTNSRHSTPRHLLSWRSMAATTQRSDTLRGRADGDDSDAATVDMKSPLKDLKMEKGEGERLAQVERRMLERALAHRGSPTAAEELRHVLGSQARLQSPRAQDEESDEKPVGGKGSGWTAARLRQERKERGSRTQDVSNAARAGAVGAGSKIQRGPNPPGRGTGDDYPRGAALERSGRPIAARGTWGMRFAAARSESAESDTLTRTSNREIDPGMVSSDQEMAGGALLTGRRRGGFTLHRMVDTDVEDHEKTDSGNQASTSEEGKGNLFGRLDHFMSAKKLEAQSLFLQYDKDKDGLLDSSEIREMILHIAGRINRTEMQYFKVMIGDDAGDTASFEDLLKKVSECAKAEEASLKRALGLRTRLSELGEAFKAAVTGSRERAQDLFNTFDHNRKGFLDPENIDALAKELMPAISLESRRLLQTGLLLTAGSSSLKQKVTGLRFPELLRKLRFVEERARS